MIRRREGCTLLELLLSLFFSVLLAAMVLPFLQLQRSLWERGERVREERRTIASALELLARDLRNAGYHDDRGPLESVEAGSVVYFLSRDAADPAAFSAANRRRVSVTLKGGDLMYRVQSWDESRSAWRRGSTQKLASAVAAFEVRSVDSRGKEAESPSEAAALRVTLTGRRPGALGTLVALRNRGGRR